MEGHGGRSWKVFSHHWIDISGEKSYGWGGWPVGLYCQPKSHSLSSGLWILDLDLGPGFRTWICVSEQGRIMVIIFRYKSLTSVTEETGLRKGARMGCER